MKPPFQNYTQAKLHKAIAYYQTTLHRLSIVNKAVADAGTLYYRQRETYKKQITLWLEECKELLTKKIAA